MENPVVEIDDGKLRGTTIEAFYGGVLIISAFLGIPYAKPPVGELRFKAPEPAKPWKGIRNATKDGSACYQEDFLTKGEYFGSEDCLFLNVYSKNISPYKYLKPVAVFFHGGGFIQGSSSSDLYPPVFLLSNDIVFVTVNYRLGVLGFLSLDNPKLEVPGNAGLKDQVLALKWVQKNIRKFGGDPRKVTIYGQNAGSAAVNYHLLSPSSKGLFHRGIMESGSVLNPWPYLNPKYLDIVKFLPKKCKCRSDREILEALNSSTVEELVVAQTEWIETLEDATFHTFAPTIEKPNPTAFLTKCPIDIITSGKYNKVSMMVGFVSNEGLFAAIDKKEPERFAKGNFRPQQMVYPDDEETKKKVIEKMKKLYGSDEYEDNLYLPSGDSMFTAGIVAMAEHFAKSNPEPVYFYLFDVVAKRNLYRYLFNLKGKKYIGASHSDELGYIYDLKLLRDLPPRPCSFEELVVRRIMVLVGNFIIDGNPTPKGNEFNITWKPMGKDKKYYLNHAKELTIKRDPAEDRMKIWKKAYDANRKTRDYFPD